MFIIFSISPHSQDDATNPPRDGATKRRFDHSYYIVLSPSVCIGTTMVYMVGLGAAAVYFRRTRHTDYVVRPTRI